MIPKVFAAYGNASVQTDISVLAEDSPYNDPDGCSFFPEGEKDFGVSHLTYEPEMVEGVIQPLGVAADGTAINHHVPRLFKSRHAPMILNLYHQIEQNSACHDQYVREMAAALIPGLSDKNYHSVFTTSLHLPYRTVDAQLLIDGSTEYENCIAIFAIDGTLTIESEKRTLRCTIDIWERLPAGHTMKIIFDNKPFGSIMIQEDVDPMSFDDPEVPPPMLRSLGVGPEDDMSCLISTEDTSFVDILLCLPEITQKETGELLAILQVKKLLSPYIRSKVCKFQLSEPGKQQIWPDILGRFIFLLDPNWTYQNIPLLRNNDVMAIFRHVKDMKGGALLVLRTAFMALEELRDMDEILFFWTLLFMSIMKNATLAKESNAARLENKMLMIWKELQKKSQESNTRKLSEEVINYVKSIRKFKLDPIMHEEEDFLKLMISKYHKSIITILLANPYKKEESHPLFYPVVFQLETALIKAANNEDYISSESESMVSDLGSYSSNGSYSMSSTHSTRLSTHSTRITDSVQKTSTRSSKRTRTNDFEDSMSSGSYSSHHSTARSSRSSHHSSRAPINSMMSYSSQGGAEEDFNQSRSIHSSRSKSRSASNAEREISGGEYSSKDYSDANSNQYSRQYSKQYSEHSTKQYSKQYSEHSTNQYSKQYSEHNTNQYSKQYSEPSSKQYSKQYSENNTNQYSKQYSEQNSAQYSEQEPKQYSKEYSKQYSSATGSYSNKKTIPGEEYSDEYYDDDQTPAKEPTQPEVVRQKNDDQYSYYSDYDDDDDKAASKPATPSTKQSSKTKSTAEYSSQPKSKATNDDYDYGYYSDEDDAQQQQQPVKKTTQSANSGTNIDSGYYSDDYYD